MTSKPASRKVRAMTLAPRSWPSSPGLATSTRYAIGCTSLNSYRFLEDAEHFAHRLGDLTNSGVGTHGVDNIRHEWFLWISTCRVQVTQILLHRTVIAATSYLT